MTFKQIFDRNAPINGGLFPIWLSICIITLFIPGFWSHDSFALGLLPIGWLIGLHWLFRFGKWIEFKFRKR